MKEHPDLTSPTESMQQGQSTVLQLDEEHRQHREDSDRRYAAATEAIVAEAIVTGDEDILLRPDDAEVNQADEARERDRSGVENRVKLRPRLKRLQPQQRPAESTYDNLSVDFTPGSDRGHNLFRNTGGVSGSTEPSALPSLYHSEELTHLLPNIRLHDEDESDLAAREYRHRTHQQKSPVSTKVRPIPRAPQQQYAPNETSNNSNASLDHRTIQQKLMVETKSKVGTTSSGSNKGARSELDSTG
eukprot:CAMPEP_0194049528 /NCGR_PEP_ID=MMETSP0009_2-20130614/30732_1 /TAXON_ID=210454 /ORGANISM="Grammatophora oceanica, Strain CCMP 410" /LENGTH=244 /DNA_ID=CAMNT_0038695707 /DNA_START=117 /DNA_END=851 /DNA_ORIENTATION=+